MKTPLPAKATKLSHSVEINASKEQVWEVVKQIEDIANFHPLVKESYRINEIPGQGAKRVCKLLPMGEMVEEIVEWQDGHGFAAEVIGGKMLPPHTLMMGKLKLEGRGTRTLATFTFSYLLKYGVLGRIMNILLIKPQFKGAPVKYVEGLKAYVESA